MKLKPEEQACFEAARRVVCGDRAELHVFEDGTFVTNGVAFKLEPSRDEIDALIVAVAKAIQFHLGGIDLGELRRDLIATGMGEQTANLVHDHLGEFSGEDWAHIRARITFYRDDNARMNGTETTTSGES